MERVKILSWLLSAIILATMALPFTIGLASSHTLSDRVWYNFFHANLFHALANAWCLMSLSRAGYLSLWMFPVAFAVACLVPDCCLSEVPTVGFSGVCYALVGLSFCKQERPYVGVMFCVALILASTVIPNVNYKLHAWCYAAGLAVGMSQTKFFK